MKSANTVLASATSRNIDEQAEIFDYIKKHPSREGKLAKKAYIRSIIIILIIIFFIMIPLCIHTLVKTSRKPKYPDGATKLVRGHISLYDDTFWYTDSSKKYEFDLSDYTNDTFENGEIINIYLDDNNNVVSIFHKDENKGYYDISKDVAVMLLVPIILLLLHYLISGKTYCKWWYLYMEWYRLEIKPYRFQNNFEEIVSEKKFYNVKKANIEEK